MRNDVRFRYYVIFISQELNIVKTLVFDKRKLMTLLNSKNNSEGNSDNHSSVESTFGGKST